MSITLEAISLLIVLLLTLYHMDRQQRASRRYQFFTVCLALSALTILLNIASIVCINYASSVPLWLNNTLSTSYFLAQHANQTVLMGYGFYLLNEHVPGKECMVRASSIVIGLGALMEVLVVFNPWTKWFFHFEEGQYVFFFSFKHL